MSLLYLRYFMARSAAPVGEPWPDLFAQIDRGEPLFCLPVKPSSSAANATLSPSSVVAATLRWEWDAASYLRFKQAVTGHSYGHTGLDPSELFARFFGSDLGSPSSAVIVELLCPRAGPRLLDEQLLITCGGWLPPVPTLEAALTSFFTSEILEYRCAHCHTFPSQPLPESLQSPAVHERRTRLVADARWMLVSWQPARYLPDSQPAHHLPDGQPESTPSRSFPLLLDVAPWQAERRASEYVHFMLWGMLQIGAHDRLTERWAVRTAPSPPAGRHPIRPWFVWQRHLGCSWQEFAELATPPAAGTIILLYQYHARGIHSLQTLCLRVLGVSEAE
jgi:hypothetical protein